MYSLVDIILCLSNIILRTVILFHTPEDSFISRLAKELLSKGVTLYPQGLGSPFKKVDIGSWGRGSSRCCGGQADAGPESLQKQQQQHTVLMPSRFAL